MGVKEEKSQLRAKVWRMLEERGIARFPLPCWGRIPNFDGSERAAEKLRLLQEWKNAKVIFANPDYAQRKVRENVLREGKLLVMASPRLKHGYILVDPKVVRNKERFASTIRGAFKLGKQVKEFPKPDLVVTGSVAVDQQGHRLGKGHGYGDREIRVIRTLFGNVPVVTLIHEAQLLEYVPSEPHDERVSIIVTPERVVRVKFEEL